MRKRKATPTASVGQPRDVFKVSDIKEESLINAVTQKAGISSGDAEVTGFIKSVIPRFSDRSANQAIRSLSNMAKEFGKPVQGGASAASVQGPNSGAQGGGQATGQSRRPGRPKGSRNKATGERAQASSGKRGPGRPKKSEHPRS